LGLKILLLSFFAIRPLISKTAVWTPVKNISKVGSLPRLTQRMTETFAHLILHAVSKSVRFGRSFRPQLHFSRPNLETEQKNLKNFISVVDNSVSSPYLVQFSPGMSGLKGGP